MSRLLRKSSVPGLLSLAALLFLVVPSMADDKPAPSYNETATVLATIDKHGHFYQVATDSKIYLFMCTKVKTFQLGACLLYTSPSPRDGLLSRMPSSA